MFPHYSPQNLLFAELIQRNVYVNGLPLLLFSVLCPLLIWLIARNVLKKGEALVPPLIFLFSPWIWYLALADSFYIFLLFLTLLIAYGITLIKKGKPYGSTLVILASLTAIYSSVIGLILIPITIIILLLSGMLNLNNFKTSIIFLILLTLPLFVLIDKNLAGFKSSFERDIKIFSDPGLLNSVNRYQGAAGQVGLRNLSRVSENKYLFYSEYLVFKYISQLTPDAFFSPQYKLLGFSFSPPVLLGFVIPFFYGLHLLLKKSQTRKIILVSTLLVIPSVFAKDVVSLNRLILIFPTVVFVISFGLTYMYKFRSSKVVRIFMTLFLFLIVFQAIIMINDIRFREMRRFNLYFGKEYTLVEP